DRQKLLPGRHVTSDVKTKPGGARLLTSRASIRCSAFDVLPWRSVAKTGGYSMFSAFPFLSPVTRHPSRVTRFRDAKRQTPDPRPQTLAFPLDPIRTCDSSTRDDYRGPLARAFRVDPGVPKETRSG